MVFQDPNHSGRSSAQASSSRSWIEILRAVSLRANDTEREFVPSEVLDAIDRLRDLEENHSIEKSLLERRSLVKALSDYAGWVVEIERYAAFGHSGTDHYQSALFDFLRSDRKLADFCEMCRCIDEGVRPGVICNGLFDSFAPRMFQEALESLSDDTPSPYISDLAFLTKQNARVMVAAVIKPAVHFTATMYARGHIEDLSLLGELCFARHVTFAELQDAATILQNCYFAPTQDDAVIMLRLGANMATELPASTEWYLQPPLVNVPYVSFGFYSSLVCQIASGHPSDTNRGEIGELLDKLSVLRPYVDEHVIQSAVPSLQRCIVDLIVRSPSNVAGFLARRAEFLLNTPWGPQLPLLWNVCSCRDGVTNIARASEILEVCLESPKVTAELGRCIRKKLDRSNTVEVEKFHETVATVLCSFRKKRIDSLVVDNALSLLRGYDPLPPKAIREVLHILGVPSVAGIWRGVTVLPWVRLKHKRPSVLNRARDIIDRVGPDLGATARWRLGID